LELAKAGAHRAAEQLEAARIYVHGLDTQLVSARSWITENPADAATFPAYRECWSIQQRSARNALDAAGRQLLTLHADLLEKQRKVRLLERLRERRFEGWSTEMLTEQENFAAEAYLAQFGIAARSPVDPPVPSIEHLGYKHRTACGDSVLVESGYGFGLSRCIGEE
jgi:hypothetical protein